MKEKLILKSLCLIICILILFIKGINFTIPIQKINRIKIKETYADAIFSPQEATGI